MAAMPFAGALSGVMFDGDGAWDLSRNRLVLHVLPGIAAVGLGYLLLRAARRPAGAEPPPWLPAVAAGAFLVSVWMGAGPWILDALLPAKADSGLMFHGIPGFKTFSASQQMALEALCHWVPGMIALAGAWAATLVLRAGRHLTRVTAA
jgi:hypothetical protein